MGPAGLAAGCRLRGAVTPSRAGAAGVGSDVDDALMEQALKAGPFKTKKDAVEAGLRLLRRARLPTGRSSSGAAS